MRRGVASRIRVVVSEMKSVPVTQSVRRVPVKRCGDDVESPLIVAMVRLALEGLVFHRSLVGATKTAASSSRGSFVSTADVAPW